MSSPTPKASATHGVILDQKRPKRSALRFNPSNAQTGDRSRLCRRRHVESSSFDPVFGRKVGPERDLVGSVSSKWQVEFSSEYAGCRTRRVNVALDISIARPSRSNRFAYGMA
jgi:hypothetical protein